MTAHTASPARSGAVRSRADSPASPAPTPAPDRRAQARARRSSRRVSVETRTFGVLKWVIIVVTVLVCAGPLIYGIFLSLRDTVSVTRHPLQIIPPLGDWHPESYLTALKSTASGGFGLAGFMGNSAVVAGGSMLLAIGASVLGGYAAVRLRFFGRETVNAVFLGIYLFPTIVLAVPMFVMFSHLGMRHSLVTLIIVYLAQTVPVSLYMLRNYFQAIPESVEEAAMLDGCTRMQTIRKVVMPLAMPGVVATALYVFMIAWNEFLFAFLFLLDDRDRWTVSLGVRQLSDSLTVSPTVLMAGSIAITLPIVIVFMFAQRALVAGLAAGAEKG